MWLNTRTNTENIIQPMHHVCTPRQEEGSDAFRTPHQRRSGEVMHKATFNLSMRTHARWPHVTSIYASNVPCNLPRHSKPWTVHSHDDTHLNETLLGSLVPRCLLGTAFSVTKDLAIDFDADPPDRGGSCPLCLAIVIHPLDLAPRFLKLLVEQCQMARRRERARRMWVM